MIRTVMDNNNIHQHQVEVESQGSERLQFARANITWQLAYEENEGDYIDVIHRSVPVMKHHLEDYQEERSNST